MPLCFSPLLFSSLIVNILQSVGCRGFSHIWVSTLTFCVFFFSFLFSVHKPTARLWPSTSKRIKSCHYLLEVRKYTHCTHSMSHSDRLTFSFDIPLSSLWHGQLEHLSNTDVTHLSKARYIPNISFADHQFYEHFQYGKQAATSNPTTLPRESRII